MQKNVVNLKKTQVGHQDLPKHRANAYANVTKEIASEITNNKSLFDVTDLVKLRSQRSKEAKFYKLAKKIKKGKK